MTEAIKILVLEDNPTDAELIQSTLSRSEISTQVTVVTNGEDFIETLRADKPDIILSDHSLPGFSSWQALQLSREKYPDIAFILITGAMTDELAAELIRHGADDYLLKGNLKRLPTAISLVLSKKKAEDSYYESEANLRTIFEHTDSAYVLIDEEFRIIFMNHLAVLWASRVMGKSLKTGENIFEYAAANNNNRLMELKRRIETGQPVTYETQYIGPSESAWYYVRFLPVKGKTHRIRNYTVAISDITGQKNFELERASAEEKLRKAHERLLFHVENAPLGFIEWDSTYHVKSWSKRAELIFGWTEQELLDSQESGFNLIYDEDLSWVSQAIDQLLSGSTQTKTIQCRNFARNGRLIWCEWFNSVQKNAEGEVVAIMSLVLDITEQRNVQLQREFDRYNLEALINNTDDLMWSVDSNLRLITCNKSFDRNIGERTGLTIKKGDNVTGKEFAASSFGNYENYYKRALGGEAFTEIEHIESPESWRELSFYPIRRRGEVVGTACFSRDITGNVIAEKRLAVREKRFRALIENSYDAIILHDASTNLMYQSSAATRILGYSTDELLDNPVIDLVHPEDRRDMEELYKAAMELAGQPLPFQLRFRHKHGHFVWLEGVVTNLLNDPNIAAFVLNYRDMTKRKEIEEDLAVTIRRFEQAQQIGHLGHWQVDFNTNRSHWSDEAFRIYGMQPGACEASEELFLSYIHPDDLRQVKEIMELALKTMKSFSFYHRIIQQSGNVRTLFSVGQFEFDISGKATGLYGISLDVTELTEKEKALEHANKEMGSFIYRTYHDLRAPVASILGLVNLISTQVHTVELQEYIEKIGNVARNQQTMLKNLATAMAIKTKPLDIEKIDVEILMRDLARELSAWPEFTKQSLHVLNSLNTTFVTDPELLHHILAPLAVNAIRYKKPSEALKIVVSFKNRGNSVIVEVSDNGIGIPTEIKEMIFEMFYRGTSLSSGSGLGLYMVKNAVNRLNGDVNVESEDGAGSIFTITIPNMHDEEIAVEE
jgi:PAS domain S-box-containing protein